jgi:hypothetical protein
MIHPEDHQAVDRQPTAPGDDAVRARLAALRVDPPDDGFAFSLHRRLVEAGPPPAPSGWAALVARLREPRLRWPALGLAAGVAAFLVLAPLTGRWWRGDAGGQAGGPAAVLATSQVAVVRLNLSADVAVADARIRITLPAGLSFWSDGQALAQRDFEWSQPLTAGDNEIPIAVRGQQAGRYRIAVDAMVGGQRVEDTVLIEVTPG